MRSLSWIIVVLALIISWNVFEKSEGLSWRNQVSVQLGLKEFIQNYITTELPQATNLEFVSLWSEKANEDQLKVHFEYYFDHPTDMDSTRMQLKGSAYLTPIEGDAQSSWALGAIEINEESLKFLKGTVIGDDIKEETGEATEDTEVSTDAEPEAE